MLSGAITPLFVGLLRLNTRIGVVNVDDMIVPYLSGYPKLSLSRLTGKFGSQNGMILPMHTNAKIYILAPLNAKKLPFLRVAFLLTA